MLAPQDCVKLLEEKEIRKVAICNTRIQTTRNYLQRNDDIDEP